MSSKTSTGFILIVLAAFFWAIAAPLAKYLFQAGIIPTDLVQARISYSFIILGIALLLLKKDLLKIAMADLPYFLVLGVLGFAMVQFTYFYAISKIDVGIAIALQYTAPTMVVLYSIFILKKQVSKITLLAISFALFGCYQVIGASEVAWSDLNWEGILAGLASALAFAFYTIYGEKGLARYSSWTVFFYALLFATIFWNIAHPPFVLVGQGWSWSIWLMIIAVAVLGTLLPFSLFLLALKRLDPIRVTVTSTLEPIFATITAYFFLNELLTVKQIIGACFILFSVILMALQKKESPPQGGELFHSQN